MRIRSVVHLHTVNRFAAFGLPLVIMGTSFAFILIMGGVVVVGNGSPIPAMYEGMRWNGAIFALLGPLLGFGVIAMTQYFPLSTGLGLTRREFAAGTGIVFVGNAVLFSAVVMVGKLIEVASNGWGLGVRFFDVYYTGIGPAWQTFVQTFLIMCAMMFVGAALATVVNRWGQQMLWFIGLAFMFLVLVVIAAGILSVLFRDWVFTLPGMGWLPWMGVLALIGAIGAVAWFALVRRAQAR